MTASWKNVENNRKIITIIGNFNHVFENGESFKYSNEMVFNIVDISAKNNPENLPTSILDNPPTFSLVQKAFDGVTENNFTNFNASWVEGQNNKKTIKLTAKTGYIFNTNLTSIFSQEISFEPTITISGIVAKNDVSSMHLSDLDNPPTFSLVQKAFDGVTENNFTNFNASWVEGQNNKKTIKLTAKNGYTFSSTNKSSLEKISNEIEIINLRLIKGVSYRNSSKNVTDVEIGNVVPTFLTLKRIFKGMDEIKYSQINAEWIKENESFKIVLKPKNGYIFESIENNVIESGILKNELVGLTQEIVKENFASGGIWENMSFISESELLSYNAINFNAFRNSNIEGIEFPSNILTLGESAFQYSSIKSIHIPKTLSKIDQYAFSICLELETVTFEEGVETIAKSMFEGSNKIKKIYIPKSVTSIKRHAFLNTKFDLIEAPISMKDKITLDSGLTSSEIEKIKYY
ncbi:MAG: leucine-rich repeat domain-containing protein [Metamycoplasmataceae bacterium]